jgi:hypothetical protein
MSTITNSLTVITPKSTTLGGALANFQVEKPETFRKLNIELLNNSKFQISIDGFQFAFDWAESGCGVGLFLERLADVWQQGKSNRETFPDAISLGFVTNRYYRSFSGLSGNSDSVKTSNNKETKHSLYSYALTLRAEILSQHISALQSEEREILRLASESLDSQILDIESQEIKRLNLHPENIQKLQSFLVDKALEAERELLKTQGY